MDDDDDDDVHEGTPSTIYIDTIEKRLFSHKICSMQFILDDADFPRQ